MLKVLPHGIGGTGRRIGWDREGGMEMKQSIAAGLSALLMAVFLPLLLLSPMEQREPENTLLIIEDGGVQEAVNLDEGYILRLKTGEQVVEIDLDTYLTGVVLSEMPASFSQEALKAQAVAARTFTLRQMQNSKHEDCDLCGNSSCCQAWTSREALQDKLGTSWTQYWEKAAAAVSDTDGVVLTYGGKLIDAVYFSCSGGTTEAAAAVWGSDIPYLQSVPSEGEEQASRYESTITIPLDQFRALLQKENSAANLSGPAAGWFGDVVKSDGGGVYTMDIGGETFYGTRLRSLFGLNSTKFTVAVTEEGIEFSVRGFGHGVGMSQYGANAMAQDGSDYKEILSHYYTGVNLEKVPRR